MTVWILRAVNTLVVISNKQATVSRLNYLAMRALSYKILQVRTAYTVRRISSTPSLPLYTQHMLLSYFQYAGEHTTFHTHEESKKALLLPEQFDLIIWEQ